MSHRAFVIGAVAIAMSGSAYAKDPLVYSPPEQGSQFYQATPTWAAHVELGIGGLVFDDEVYGLLEVAGRAAKPVGSGPWNIELEGYGQSIFDSSNAFSMVGAYVHAFHRTPQSALGVFGGIATYGAPLFVLGAEGNWYFDRFVLKGQVAYNAPFDSGSDGFVMLRGGVDYYITANHKIGGYLAFEGGSSFDATEIGLEGERRFGNHFSGFGRVAAITAGVAANDTFWRFMLGVRAFSDNGDLRMSDELVPFAVRFIPYD